MSNYIYISSINSFRNEFISFEEKELTELGKIASINLFIGANNSRKSRLMRSLLRIKRYTMLSNKISDSLDSLKSSFGPLLTTMNDNDQINLKIKHKGELDGYKQYEDLRFIINLTNSNINRIISVSKGYFSTCVDNLLTTLEKDEIDFEAFRNSVTDFIALLELLLNFDESNKSGYPLNSLMNIHFQRRFDFREVFKLLERPVTILKTIALVHFEEHEPSKIYVPTLRSAITIYNENGNNISKVEEDMFKNTISNHYNLDEKKDNIEIVTGLDLFKKIKKNRNSIREIRDKFTAFENFLKLNFFEDKDIDIIALEEENNKDEHIKIYIKGEPDRDVHDLGDGIQSLIMILYPIFMAKDESWIFIEEPELNMHPGLQHLFLKTILFDKNLVDKKLRYFMTTHSNHLLNLSINYSKLISVFAFEKFSKNNLSNSKVIQVIGNDTKILDLLGVYNSSVFMANCSIWIEGVSDRRYLKAFLAAYIRDNNLNKYHEDLHYSFFEYAGTNLQHYLFEQNVGVPEELEKIKAHFLSNKIFLLADQDKLGWKQDKHILFKSWIRDKFYYHTTGALEIENTLSIIILKKIFVNLLKFDKTIVDKLSFEENAYKDERLGEFISTKFKNKVKSFPSLREKGGTLTTKYKNKFSKFVLEEVEAEQILWSDISQNIYAKELTEKLYKFIEKHNSSY